jgi:hypothetical protein
MREDYQNLTNEYIDLREDYNVLQGTKKPWRVIRRSFKTTGY